MFIPMEVSEIIDKVHTDDVKKAEARYNVERDKRNALRAQDDNAGLNTSELLRKLSTIPGENETPKDEILRTPGVTPPQEPSDDKPRPAGFPAPPTGPASR